MCGPDATSGGVATHTKNLIEELEKLGVIVISHSIHGPLHYKLYQRTIGLFCKVMNKREEYDLIHIQASGGLFSFISAITGAISSKIFQKRLLITFHHSKTQKFVADHKNIFKFVLNRSDTLILVSDKQKKAIDTIFGDVSEKFIVIPNGFKDSLFYSMDTDECRARLKLPLDKKIIFNISNLTESKGHTYLLSAIPDVISVYDNCLFYIAGKGYFADALTAQVNNLGLQSKVTFLGWIPDEQVPVWMNACDLFVLPSLAEGNPIVMFEALGCGKPFVGTRVGGVPEVITSDEYGLLVEPADPDDLAEKILAGLDQEWDREAILGYAEQFTWKRIAEEILGVYEQILG